MMNLFRWIPGLKQKISGTVLLVFFAAFLIPLELHSQFYPKYEMRAVWIATVGNIDWPSSSALSTDDQKKEMLSLLDIIKTYNMNTVVLQIRPAADSFYSSSLEPWSQWLTGKQGKAPDPFYDPLEFVITECRKRGLDIHAWLNPYRALTDTNSIASPDHITKLHPEWFLRYAGTTYFDPGLTETRNYVAGIVSDVVRRYDIDAIHMDDYFYPYRISKLSFPDDSTFSRNSRGFAQEHKEDWRRDNVNLIIKQISDSIKTIKPWVEFGVSPFGVWRNIDKDPKGSETKAGQTNYDDLYADILLWQRNGWINYITPQLYWHRGFRIADYDVLSDWWSLNSFTGNLYVGQAPYRISKSASVRSWRSSKEITRQIQLLRSYPNINGSMFFSAKVFRKNPLKLKERLTASLYRYPSLPPSNKMIVPIMPGKPSCAIIKMNDNILHFSWKKEDSTRKFILYKFRKSKPADMNDARNIFLITTDTTTSVALSRKTDVNRHDYYVTAMSRTNSESDPARFGLNRMP